MTPRSLAGGVVVLVLSVVRSFAAVYPPEQGREDLAFLYETLQAGHYDLFAHRAKPDYDRVLAEAKAGIVAPLDELGAYRVFQSFTALAGMAHCNVGLPFNTDYVPYVMNGGPVILLI